MNKKGLMVTPYLILCLWGLILFDPIGTCQYLYGYFNGHFVQYLLYSGLFFLLFGGFYLLLFVLLAVNSLDSRFRGQKARFYVSAAGLLLPVAMFGAKVATTRGTSGLEEFMNGFYQRMEKQADLEKIREWMLALDERSFTDLTHEFHPEESDRNRIPAAIFIFDPKISYVETFIDGEGLRCIDLEWGGPFGRWGIVIGPAEMKTPPSDTERYGRNRFTAEAGIYVWQQIR